MSFLRSMGPASMQVWISSPVRSRNPVLMNTMRSARRLDAGGEVDGGAPLLVHDAHFHRVARKHRAGPRRGEQIVGEGDFVGPMHLRLHDIDRARAAVAWRRGADIVHGDRAGNAASSRVSGDSGFGLVQHRIGEHVVADVAHQHQAAPMERDLPPSGPCSAVRVEPRARLCVRPFEASTRCPS